MPRYACFVLSVSLLTPFAAVAQTTESAATEPAATQSLVDAASPKGSLKAYNQAMRTGDLKTMLSLQHADSEEEKHFARCSSQADLEVAHLLQAAKAKFGIDGAKALAEAIGDEDDAAIEAATETDDGNKATIKFSGSDTSVPMVGRHTDGSVVWAVDVGQLLRDTPDGAEALCDELIHRGSAAKVTAQEISAGQYTSAGKAAEALKGRLKES